MQVLNLRSRSTTPLRSVDKVPSAGLEYLLTWSASSKHHCGGRGSRVDANAEKAYATSYGTMPGAPNADVGFQFALQASLEALDCHLAAEGLSARLELAGHTGLAAPPTTWLDDIALLITSDRADTLPANVSRAASLAAQYLRILGVRTNFAAGKTEAILHLCGQGTRRVQQTMSSGM